MINKDLPRTIAEELCSVQPMSKEVGEAFMTLMKNAQSPEELRKQGYRPVSNMGLMWVKEAIDE